MPLYYIDFQDGDKTHIDDVGSDLRTRDLAREEAVGQLPEIARATLPNGEHRVFAAAVRDEAGRVLYRATLTFDGAWV